MEYSSTNQHMHSGASGFITAWWSLKEQNIVIPCRHTGHFPLCTLRFCPWNKQIQWKWQHAALVEYNTHWCTFLNANDADICSSYKLLMAHCSGPPHIPTAAHRPDTQMKTVISHHRVHKLRWVKRLPGHLQYPYKSKELIKCSTNRMETDHPSALSSHLSKSWEQQARTKPCPLLLSRIKVARISLRPIKSPSLWPLQTSPTSTIVLLWPQKLLSFIESPDPLSNPESTPSSICPISKSVFVIVPKD